MEQLERQLILFEVDDVQYSLPIEAIDYDLVVLPDSRIYQIEWIGELSPQIGELTPLPHLFMNLSAEKITSLMNATVAQKV